MTTTTKLFNQVRMAEGDDKIVGLSKKKQSLRRRMWRKLQLGGKGRGRESKGIICCDEKVVIWEVSFFCYQTRQSGP